MEFKCRHLLLLQNYVHPMKNYISDGEIVLHYAGGTQAITQAITSLVPPLNLDCYFQHFSRGSATVPLGEFAPASAGCRPFTRLCLRFTRTRWKLPATPTGG